jgi:hypothetical protein
MYRPIVFGVFGVVGFWPRIGLWFLAHGLIQWPKLGAVNTRTVVFKL